MPLVELLPVRRGDSGLEAGSGLAFLKEWGAIAFPIVLLAIMILFVPLRSSPFGFQIALVLAYTSFVFLLVFCDTRGSKGYSLSEKAVRQKLPLLLCIHAGFLAFMFAVATGAILLRPHLPLFWTLARDAEGRGRFSNLSYFDLISGLTGVAIMFTQTFISRGILERALKDEKRSGVGDGNLKALG